MDNQQQNAFVLEQQYKQKFQLARDIFSNKNFNSAQRKKALDGFIENLSQYSQIFSNKIQLNNLLVEGETISQELQFQKQQEDEQLLLQEELLCKQLMQEEEEMILNQQAEQQQYQLQQEQEKQLPQQQIQQQQAKQQIKQNNKDIIQQPNNNKKNQTVQKQNNQEDNKNKQQIIQQNNSNQAQTKIQADQAKLIENLKRRIQLQENQIKKLKQENQLLKNQQNQYNQDENQLKIQQIKNNIKDDKHKKPKQQQQQKPQPQSEFAELIEEAILNNKKNIHWDDIAGLESAKQFLKEAVLAPIQYPHLFVGQRKPWKGILLYGPPGTGKTFLAQAAANEIKATFFLISPADLISKWVGQSEKMIKTLFQVAKEKQPSIIFIDEVDSFTVSRDSANTSEHSQKVVNQFLTEMQGVADDTQGLLILGATNMPWSLDPAMRRRFEKRIYISLPDLNTRKSLLQKVIAQNDTQLNDQQLTYIAQMTEGFSCADIALLNRDAVFQPYRKMESCQYFLKVAEGQNTFYYPIQNYQNGAVEKNNIDTKLIKLQPTNFDDFMFVLKSLKPTVSKQDLIKYQQFTEQFGGKE